MGVHLGWVKRNPKRSNALEAPATSEGFVDSSTMASSETTGRATSSASASLVTLVTTSSGASATEVLGVTSTRTAAWIVSPLFVAALALQLRLQLLELPLVLEKAVDFGL